MSVTPLNALQLFLTVARRGSFVAAASELGISTPALSQGIRKLEQRVGVALLTRTTRRVALTDAGRQLLNEAGPALEQALAALSRAASRSVSVTGRVRISLPPLALPYFISPVVPRFVAEYPDVELELHVDNRRVDLVKEGFDAGVRFEEFVEKDMVQLRLTQPFRFVVAAAPKYLAQRGAPKTPRDLLQHACIGYRSANSAAILRWELERGKKSYRVPVPGHLVSNDERVIVELAQAGLGLCYVFEPQIAPLLERGSLQLVLERYAAQVPGLFLFFPHRAQVSRAMRAFIEVLRSTLSKTETGS